MHSDVMTDMVMGVQRGMVGHLKGIKKVIIADTGRDGLPHFLSS